jgi:hypothetical protein
MDGGGNFRANFGVEKDGKNLLAEDGSHSKGADITTGYPELDHVLLKKLGWWGELTDAEKALAESLFDKWAHSERHVRGNVPQAVSSAATTRKQVPATVKDILRRPFVVIPAIYQQQQYVSTLLTLWFCLSSIGHTYLLRRGIGRQQFSSNLIVELITEAWSPASSKLRDSVPWRLC